MFIAALRAGKTADEALEQYCWAKRVLPIDRGDWEAGRQSVAHLWRSMAGAKGADAFDAGAPDEEIAKEFDDGISWDFDRDLLWRAMDKHEGPSSGQLIGSLSAAGKEQYLAMREAGLPTPT